MADSPAPPKTVHASPSRAALVSVRPGAIVLARHGEPALSRKCFLTSDQYRDWWARYEVGGLLAGQTPPPELLATADQDRQVQTPKRVRRHHLSPQIFALLRSKPVEKVIKAVGSVHHSEVYL